MARQNLQNKPSFYDAEENPTLLLSKSSKSIYYILVKLKKQAVTSQSRWKELFPTNNPDQHTLWSNIYRNPYKTARDTKLQAFQFRILHRFLPCNKYLKNIRIRREDTCSFCTELNTTEHFLFACPMVRSFWGKITSWLERETDLRLILSTESVIFGVPDTFQHTKVINFIILFTKFFIYQQKLFHQGALDITHFLHDRLHVEKYLTTLEAKQHLFHKWQRIYTALG